ncbi:MAG: four helix bundle protein [Patescibacteria group bacterium]
MGNGYKDLIVWQKSKKFCINVYKLTEEFPKSEIFGLTSQLRRAAVSIPSNIAEGSKRNTSKDQHQFYAIAYGSGAEIETQLEISKELFPQLEDKIIILGNDISEIMRMLNKLRTS